MEAQRASEMLRSQHLTLQELESRVEQQSLRLEEMRPIWHSLEINGLKSMRLLTMCLREATSIIGNRAAGP
jgi:hypothetical protein